MPGEIVSALFRLNGRKRASLGVDVDTGGHEATSDQHRAVFSEFFFQPEDLAQARNLVAEAFAHSCVQGYDPLLAVAEVFTDGVAAGMLVADARGKED